MIGRRPKRARSRTSKSKHGQQTPSKHYKVLRYATAEDDETIPAEPIHSLLLSSLKYWEVERDLIEERIAGFNR
jgi:hypothetical protein